MSSKVIKGTPDAPVVVFNPSTGMNITVTDENLPKIIKEQIKGIKDITKKVNDNTQKALDLKDEATKLKEAGIKTFHKKAAIKALQELAKNSTELQDDFAQNQKCLFENQKQLSQALKFVFAISVTSLARTTQTIHILKKELEGASKEELSEMEYQELQGLLDQLQAQEALRTKLEEHDTLFAELGEKKQDKIADLESYVKTDDSRLTDARSASDVSAWAKAKSKPSYTADEVGALSDSTFIPSKMSDLENDKGFLTEHQDISGKADVSFVKEQLRCTKDNLNQEVTTLQQMLQKTQENLQKEHQGYEKLKRALITTSIGIGTISVGALIALLILIL